MISALLVAFAVAGPPPPRVPSPTSPVQAPPVSTVAVPSKDDLRKLRRRMNEEAAAIDALLNPVEVNVRQKGNGT